MLKIILYLIKRFITEVFKVASPSLKCITILILFYLEKVRAHTVLRTHLSSLKAMMGMVTFIKT